MKKNIKLVCLTLLSLSSTSLFALEKSTVNILSWFGYLGSPEIIQLVEKECNVGLSVDEYYSNEEFIRRWKVQKDEYDVLIFSNLLYKGLKENIALKNTSLSSIS